MNLVYDGGGRDIYAPYRRYQNAIWQAGDRYYELVRAERQASVLVNVSEGIVRAANNTRWTTHILQSHRFPVDREESWETTKERLPDLLMEMLL